MKKTVSKNTLSNKPITSKAWSDYALMDSGRKRKLERFGNIILDRFEPDAIWKPASPKSDWINAAAKYEIRRKTGDWLINRQFNREWGITVDNVSIALKLSQSRHIGIFPEQLENWQWMHGKIVAETQPIKVLNLFAYTGVASLFCAKANAGVTHVDASRSAIELGKKSQTQSGLTDKPIRWIVDDARKFMLREIRRGNKYDAIIMDPPNFGRGPKGETWKFEDSIDDLFTISAELLSDHPLFFLLTSYNISLSDELLVNMTKQLMKNIPGKIEFGPLIQVEQSAGRKIEQAHYVRWSKK